MGAENVRDEFTPSLEYAGTCEGVGCRSRHACLQ